MNIFNIMKFLKFNFLIKFYLLSLENNVLTINYIGLKIIEN